jgi:hypothetical protein
MSSPVPGSTTPHLTAGFQLFGCRLRIIPRRLCGPTDAVPHLEHRDAVLFRLVDDIGRDI